MRQTATPQSPTGASPAQPYQALTFDICDAMAQLANPAHPANSAGIAPELYRQAVTAMNASRAEALARADRQPFTEARLTICFALALTAAISTLELLLAAP